MKTQGLFGPIEVVRTGRNQQLRINGQNQGGAYLAPPASVVDPSLPADAPGPASSSPYAVGWLISGVCHPSASGVMIGLGSGSGATQLLHEFPGIDLTILEIDPEVIRLATAAFPLLDYYADQGRLNIIEADAEDWLGAHTDGFQFALADAYTGEARLLDHYLEQLCRRAGSITLNVIDTLDGKSMTNVLRMLEEQGKPAQNVFRASHLGLGLNVEDGQPSNWIVTTCPTTPAELAVYAPFADVEGIGAYLTRLQWDQMLSLNVSGVGAVGRVMKAAAAPPTLAYHYLFDTPESTRKAIEEAGQIVPGDELGIHGEDYAARPTTHRRESGKVYLTPHDLQVPGADRFVFDVNRLSPGTELQLGAKKYPLSKLKELLSQIPDDEAQRRFDSAKERKFKRLLQLVHPGPVDLSGTAK